MWLVPPRASTGVRQNPKKGPPWGLEGPDFGPSEGLESYRKKPERVIHRRAFFSGVENDGGRVGESLQGEAPYALGRTFIQAQPYVAATVERTSTRDRRRRLWESTTDPTEAARICP